HQQQPGLDVVDALAPVDRHTHLHGRALPPAAASDGSAASRIARHTRCEVVGRSMCRTPRWATASTTAFWTAGVAPVVPASPTPLAPSGLYGVGVCIVTSSNAGTSVA